MPKLASEWSISGSAVPGAQAESAARLGGLLRGTAASSALGHELKGSVELSGGEGLKAAALLELKADLAHLEATSHLGRGPLGLTATLDGRVGARADVGAEATLDPAQGTYKLGAGVHAFAGLSAGTTTQLSVGELASGAATAEAWVGVGARAEGSIGYDNGHLKAHLDVGGALGVGGHGAVDLDVNADAVSQQIHDVVDRPVSSLDPG